MNWYKKAQFDNPSEPQTEKANRLNPLDGMSNDNARRFVRRIGDPLTKGFFKDEAWENIRKIWDALNQAGIDWTLTGAEYDKNDTSVMPTSKTWKIEIYFTNKNNKPTTLYGTVTAHGAGSVQDPLDRYDITFIVF